MSVGCRGDKLGKFELKDMARYLPSMLPAFEALGGEGQSGLRSLVAMLQVIRAGTGVGCVSVIATAGAPTHRGTLSRCICAQTISNCAERALANFRACAADRVCKQETMRG